LFAVVVTLGELIRPVDADAGVTQYFHFMDIDELQKVDWSQRLLSNASGIFWGQVWSDRARVLFGMITSIWAAVFVRMWTRTEAVLSSRWGAGTDGGPERLGANWHRAYGQNQARHVVEDAELEDVEIASDGSDSDQEQKEPAEVKIRVVHGPQSMHEEIYSTARNKVVSAISWFFTFIVVWIQIAVTLSIMVGLYLWLKKEKWDDTKARLVVAGCLSCQLGLANLLWPTLAEWLTNWSRPRDLPSYISSHAIKVFLVDFMASFGAPFYSAFLQQSVEEFLVANQTTLVTMYIGVR